jgi:hypothetical protein
MTPQIEEAPKSLPKDPIPEIVVHSVTAGSDRPNELDAERHALLAQAMNRPGWQRLSPLQRERARQLFLAAETPRLKIIAADNRALRERLGWSPGVSQKMVKALKEARLLDVKRRWEGVPGNYREAGPASWVYADTDALRSSQIPKTRGKQTNARLRRVERENAALRDDVSRLQRVVRDTISNLQEHV